jgi:drug/metabolite transporter (DMT)-like permease
VERLRRHRWELALIGITAIWGATFPIVKCAVERCGHLSPSLGLLGTHPTTTFMFLTLRFTLAAAIMVPATRRLPSRMIGPGLLVGGALFSGYAFQTLGLERTSASNVGFVTGLFVVLTPLFGAVAGRALPRPEVLLAVGLATAGLFLLASPTGLALGAGERIVLLTAVSFALHIVITGAFAGRVDTAAFTGFQLAVAAAASFVFTAAQGDMSIPREPGIWGAVAITAVLASALAFFVQTRAQRHLTPTRTALIITMEPVFAGVFGYLMLGERLTGRGYAGAALILVAIVIAGRHPARRDEA